VMSEPQRTYESWGVDPQKPVARLHLPLLADGVPDRPLPSFPHCAPCRLGVCKRHASGVLAAGPGGFPDRHSVVLLGVESLRCCPACRPCGSLC